MYSPPSPIFDLFPQHPALIGMIHTGPLPGTAVRGPKVEALVATAVAEARAYAEAGFDGLIVENMHDTPYLRRNVGPEIVAAMTAIVRAVTQVVQFPVGVQILAGADKAALATALAAGASFIRAEGFVFGHVADEGWMDSDAGDLLRYRRAIGAEHIRVFCDIKKKHSAHATTADVSIADTAKGAEFFRADGVIVTGTTTAMPVDLQELAAVRTAVKIPVLVGSGITPEMISPLAKHADGLIVGSFAKQDGHWANALDPERLGQLVEAVKTCRR